MDIGDYKKENAELHQRVADLEKANNELIIHNIQLGKKVDAYYDVRRRIHIYKELLLRHTEFLRQRWRTIWTICEPQIPRCLRHDPTRIPHTYRFAPHP